MSLIYQGYQRESFLNAEHLTRIELSLNGLLCYLAYHRYGFLHYQVRHFDWDRDLSAMLKVLSAVRVVNTKLH